MDLWTELLSKDVLEYEPPKVAQKWALYEVLQDFVCSGHLLQQGCTVIWDGESSVCVDGLTVHCSTLRKYRHIFREILDLPGSDVETLREPGFTGHLYCAQRSFQVANHDIQIGECIIWDGFSAISHKGEFLRCSNFALLINQGYASRIGSV